MVWVRGWEWLGESGLGAVGCCSLCCELLKGGAVAGGLGFEDIGCAVLVCGEEIGEGFWGERVGDLPRFG